MKKMDIAEANREARRDGFILDMIIICVIILAMLSFYLIPLYLFFKTYQTTNYIKERIEKCLTIKD